MLSLKYYLIQNSQGFQFSFHCFRMDVYCHLLLSHSSSLQLYFHALILSEISSAPSCLYQSIWLITRSKTVPGTLAVSLLEFRWYQAGFDQGNRTIKSDIEKTIF